MRRRWPTGRLLRQIKQNSRRVPSCVSVAEETVYLSKSYINITNVFNFALEYAIRSVQVNRDGLKLNGEHQFLTYADDVNILVESIHTLKENAEALVAATREIGLEVSVDKTKYMVMSRDQNAGRIQSVRIDNITSRGWNSLNIWEQL